MFRRFNEKFGSDVPRIQQDGKLQGGGEWLESMPSHLINFFSGYSGKVYGGGLFKIHTSESANEWTQVCRRYYPAIQEEFVCFAFDWLGRQFASDIQGLHKIWMFDPATGEMLMLEHSLHVFFEEDLLEDWDELFGVDIFERLVEKLGRPQFSKCMGFKMPLFLGGKDVFENYEVVDIEVYWELNMQLLLNIRDMPNGSKIGNINIKE